MKHPELDRMICTHPDAPTVDLECYLETYTTNLWYVYVGDQNIFELLHDSVIQSIERKYSQACKEEADNSALETALYNYELKKEMS